jgi:hypothetical protein
VCRDQAADRSNRWASRCHCTCARSTATCGWSRRFRRSLRRWTSRSRSCAWRHFCPPTTRPPRFSPAVTPPGRSEATKTSWGRRTGIDQLPHRLHAPESSRGSRLFNDPGGGRRQQPQKGAKLTQLGGHHIKAGSFQSGLRPSSAARLSIGRRSALERDSGPMTMRGPGIAWFATSPLNSHQPYSGDRANRGNQSPLAFRPRSSGDRARLS